MLKPIALVNGHYECRSLKQTLPILTDLLALEVVDQKGGEVTVKHPNTDWLLIVHEGGPRAGQAAQESLWAPGGDQCRDRSSRRLS